MEVVWRLPDGLFLATHPGEKAPQRHAHFIVLSLFNTIGGITSFWRLAWYYLTWRFVWLQISGNAGLPRFRESRDGKAQQNELRQQWITAKKSGIGKN
ncbi:MAG: hypothetical protein C5B47_01900 [Verrucomicrobia bacterium]|nr:MAG: hypothetical protein C5B47_01900 [Verrucomicrobiota bacterium]